MPFAKANGIEIAYEDHGSPEDPALLLVMGLAGQLTQWPIELIDALVDRGFRVIRFDNRDIGLSTKFDRHTPPKLTRLMLMLMLGMRPRVPYTLKDMATDGIGLLDTLGIERAHLAGISMGGMIAQIMAAEWPDRVLSLTSIMSSTGNRSLPRGNREALSVLTSRPTSGDEEELIEYSVQAALTIGSPAYRPDEARLRQRVRANVQRSKSGPGVARQLAASLAAGDRRHRLKSIKAPTMIIHGADDPLIPAACGEDTARVIPGAELKIIPGMGHDLPVQLADELADDIAANARRADA